MIEKNQPLIFSARADDDEIPAWKRLDIVIRKWAALTGFEKDQSDYQKRKEMYE
jgi:hypothetical protein